MTNLRLYIFPAGGNEIALPWGCGPQRPSELGGSNLSPVYGRDSHRTLKSAPRPVVTLSRKAEAQDSFQSPVCCGRRLVPAWTQTGSLRCPRTVCVSQPDFSEDAATCMGDSRSPPPPWLSPCHCLSGRIPLVALSWDLIVWKTHVGCGRRGPSPAVVDALVTKRGGWDPAVSPSPARRPPWSRPTN